MSEAELLPLHGTATVDAGDLLRGLDDDQLRAECARRGIGPHGAPELTGECVRGARGLLNWSVARLASASGVSVSTIKRFEIEGRCPARSGNVEALRSAFERHGVQFLDVAGRTGLLRVRPDPPAPTPPRVHADLRPSSLPAAH